MFQGILLLLLAQFIGSGIGSPLIKVGVTQMPPILFTTLRFFIATLIFLPFLIHIKRKKTLIKDTHKLMLAGFFLFCNVTFYAIGLQRSTVLMAQLIYVMMPVVVGIIGHFIYDERLTKNKIIGLFIAMVGVLFLIYQSHAKDGQATYGTLLGNILLFIAMISYSFLFSYSKKMHMNFSSTVINFYTFFFTAIFSTILLPFEFIVHPNYSHVFSFLGIVSVLGVSILNSALLYYLLQLGIKKTNAFTASLFQYLGPIFAGLVTVPLLGEKITGNFIFGGSIVLIGVFYATTLPYLKRYLLK